jgi:hypothetical protein
MEEKTTIADVASEGGKARAESLTPEERTEIARKAADARWETPKALREGNLKIGDTIIPCAVLDDGDHSKQPTRVLTQRGVFVALGRHKNPTKGQSTIDDRPGFLSAKNLEPFISNELRRSWTPIKFRLTGRGGGFKGNIAFGYRAEILPRVCEVFMNADADGKLTVNQKHIAIKARILIAGLAEVGVIALVDEATGFQDIRDRVALQEILDKYLIKEFAAWSKRFKDEFYKEIFRLRNWTWQGMKVNRPQCVAQYTKNLVWSRLAPGLLRELEKRNPMGESGSRKGKHHQLLTDDVGHPALDKHLETVTKIMCGYDNWDAMMRHIDRALPKKDHGLTPLYDNLPE